MFYIVYEVEGFKGTHKAGPYSLDDVQFQRSDIEGYEGVKNLKVIPADWVEEPTEASSEQSIRPTGPE